jgi:hypothetical protein
MLLSNSHTLEKKVHINPLNLINHTQGTEAIKNHSQKRDQIIKKTEKKKRAKTLIFSMTIALYDIHGQVTTARSANEFDFALFFIIEFYFFMKMTKKMKKENFFF